MKKTKKKVYVRREARKLTLMRHNVRRSVSLDFRCYELRVQANLRSKQQMFEMVLPTIRLRYLTHNFIGDEIKLELSRLDGIISADCVIEVFAVYQGEASLGEYHRYLGELDFFFDSLESYDTIRSHYKNAYTYAEQPEKRNFIPKRV